MSSTATSGRPRSGASRGHATDARGGGGGRRRPPPRRTARRRRATAVALALAAGGGLAAVVGFGLLDDAVREVTLPLRHDDIIRQQAEDKDLDPALIAAVIYEETRFQPRTSPAGAEGLMQITPDTAAFVAGRSGATQFELRDLHTPQINIAYGSFYLRYLIDRYEDDDRLAIAAYNAGGTNVDRWLVAADDDELDLEDIPFPETRDYVADVEERRKEYEKNYAEELGL